MTSFKHTCKHSFDAAVLEMFKLIENARGGAEISEVHVAHLRLSIQSHYDALHEMQETLEKISKANDRLTAFAENNPSPIIEIDIDGKITYLNPAARRHLPKVNTLKKRHPIFENLDQDIEKFTTTPETLIIRDVYIRNRVYRKHILYMPESQHTRIFVLDITEYQRIDDLKQQFMDAVSHELKTPLTIIKAAIESLLAGIQGALTENQTRLAKMAHDNTNRLSRLIMNILDFSDLEKGVAKATFQPTNVKTLIESALKDFTQRPLDKNIVFEQDLGTSTACVHGDPEMLHRLMFQLIDNALKYAKTTVRITAFEVGTNEIELSVIDDGPGIGEGNAHAIFNKFEQIEKIVGHGYQGTGLGLAICQDIVALHKGKIWARAEIESGTHISVLLPSAQTARTPKAAA